MKKITDEDKPTLKAFCNRVKSNRNKYVLN